MADQIERFHLPIHRYRTSDGKPTCAVDVTKKQNCLFLGTTHMGTREVCMLPGSSYRAELDRRIAADGSIGFGFLIPHKICPIWESKT